MAEIAVVFILGTTAVMASVVVSSYKESANKTRLDHYMTHYTLPADAAAAAAQQRQQQQLLQQHHHDHAADDTDDDEDDATAATESSSNLCDLKAQQLLSPAPAHGSDAPLSAATAAAAAAAAAPPQKPGDKSKRTFLPKALQTRRQRRRQRRQRAVTVEVLADGRHCVNGRASCADASTCAICLDSTASPPPAAAAAAAAAATPAATERQQQQHEQPAACALVMLTCGHVFHEECVLAPWFGTGRRTCPLCQQDLQVLHAQRVAAERAARRGIGRRIRAALHVA